MIGCCGELNPCPRDGNSKSYPQVLIYGNLNFKQKFKMTWQKKGQKNFYTLVHFSGIRHQDVGLELTLSLVTLSQASIQKVKKSFSFTPLQEVVTFYISPLTLQWSRIESAIPNCTPLYIKGQLISKCPFGVINSTKISTKIL